MDRTERNKETLREFFTLPGTDDIEGIKAFMAQDLEWVVPQDPAVSPLAGTLSSILMAWPAVIGPSADVTVAGAYRSVPARTPSS